MNVLWQNEYVATRPKVASGAEKIWTVDEKASIGVEFFDIESPSSKAFPILFDSTILITPIKRKNIVVITLFQRFKVSVAAKCSIANNFNSYSLDLIALSK